MNSSETSYDLCRFSEVYQRLVVSKKRGGSLSSPLRSVEHTFWDCMIPRICEHLLPSQVPEGKLSSLSDAE